MTMKLHKLSGKDTCTSKILLPVNEQELIYRHIDYPLLNKAQFSKKYSSMLYNPVELFIDGLHYEI